jgi:iron(III) transport system substrate-binding protein
MRLDVGKRIQRRRPMRFCIRRTMGVAVAGALYAFMASGCGENASKQKEAVVVYTALDREFSEPVFQKFERETGIRVLPKYDTESTKTVGLVNAIRAEAARPRCDVFWCNEIVNSIRLKQEGLLTPCRPAAAEPYPAMYKDADGCWFGFAARARILLINTNLVKLGEEPASIFDLVQPRWKGKIGIGKPLFGSTASHAACLFAALGEEKAKKFFLGLLANGVSIEASNRQCARSVAEGRLAIGMTDTDDGMVELSAGKPVKIVYPDSGPQGMGVLFIPNTLSIVKGAPHPQAARKLVEYLLSPSVEGSLAQSPSAQIPLNPQVRVPLQVKGPQDVKAMSVDFAQAARLFESTASWLKDHFVR